MLIECISTRHDGLKISVDSHIQNTDTHCTCTSIFAAESVDLYSFSQNTYYTFTLKVVNTQTLMFLDKLFNTTSLTFI